MFAIKSWSIIMIETYFSATRRVGPVVARSAADRKVRGSNPTLVYSEFP